MAPDDNVMPPPPELDEAELADLDESAAEFDVDEVDDEGGDDK